MSYYYENDDLSSIWGDELLPRPALDLEDGTYLVFKNSSRLGYDIVTVTSVKKEDGYSVLNNSMFVYFKDLDEECEATLADIMLEALILEAELFETELEL